MGDGRFYTMHQFISMLYLTCLIMFVVISIVLLYYKSNGERQFSNAFIAYGVLLVTIFVSAHETVVADVSKIPQLATLSKTSLILSLALFEYYCYKKRIYFEGLMVGLIFVCLMLMGIFNFSNGQTWYFVDYRFLYVIYFVVSLTYNTGIRKTLFFRVSDNIFKDVNKRMLDYAFICDNEGNVVYKNNLLKSSQYFKKFVKYDFNEVADLFIQSTEMREAYEKTFIKYSSEPVTYFQFTQKELLDEGNRLGLIVTFTDITSLIEMLDHLHFKREETRLSNIELEKYKEIVYDIEQEKEISKLLSEIAESQYDAMKNLKCEIDLLQTLDDDLYLKALDELIEMGKLQLADVRNAVSTYRNYYEGRRT